MVFFVSAVASVLAAAATFLFTKSAPYTVAVLLITFPLATLFSSLFTSSSSSKHHSKRKRSSKNNFDALLNDEAQQQASRAKKAAKKAAVAAKKAAAQQQLLQQAVSESNKSDVSASEGDDTSIVQLQQVEAAAQVALAKKAAKKARQAAKKAEQKAAAEASKQAAAATQQQQQQSTKTQTVVEKNNNKKTSKPASSVKSAVPQATATATAKPVEATVSSSRDSQSSNDGWTTKQGNDNNKAKKSSSPQTLKQAANNKQGNDANNEDVDRAKSVEISVPIEHHALLIGPKGATLQLLQQATGATIQMPRRELSSSTVTISGSGDSVNRVKGAIDSLVRLGYSSITHPGQVHDDINVDPKTIGVIIGPGGSTLKQIQSKTNTRINLPKKNSDSNKCTIIGLKTDVKQAKQCIKDLITDGFSPLIHVGIIKQTVEFPHEKIALLIGPKGQTIKSIQGNTKTKINVNSNVKDGVTVIGSAEGCAQAAKEIQRLLIPVQPVNADDEEEDDYEEVENAAAWQEQHSAPSEDQLWL